MARSNIFIGIIVAVLTFFVWAFLNRPEQEPAWPERIQGFSFSPHRQGQSPILGTYPSEAQVDADLALLAGKVHAVRTYSVEDVLIKVPELAKKHKLNVALGAWIDARKANNDREVETVLRIAPQYRNVVRVVIGNESILRNDLPVTELAAYLDRARKALAVPVSTAEPWHVWVKHPELAEHVDYLAVHMLPYWEGIDADIAVDYIVGHIEELRKLFPDKPIVIAEVGWPSNGRTRLSAVASEANQASFLRRFLKRAQDEKYIYYIMEAFDQPWKRDSEGAVGAYWGVYNVERNPKFPFSDPIVPIPNWYVLAALSVMIAAITMAFLLVDSQTLRSRGRSFLALIAFAAATACVWIIYDYIHQYLTVATVLVGVLMLVGMFGVLVVLLAEAHEWAEALWVTGRRRSFRPVQVPDDQLPMVSIHVPTYNEPPDMMIETLNHLAALDYPRFEVLVIDNNTRDKAVWQPVAQHCDRLGRRFRFVHISPLKGFKAGALNLAMRFTATNAKIIAVIDSDYKVQPSWLRDLVPQFADPQVGLVQAPQDYSDERESLFKAMCYAEYRAFFYIGMITRNERNAIIQHGTMTLVRRSVLEQLGGWGEWCITEDAELGLRIFEAGYSAVYVPKSYGRGLMPDTFMDYKKQRFRWAYGAIQILRRHANILAGSQISRLRAGQRYHFVAGWLPWVADGVNLLFTLAALAWSAAMILYPRKVDPPLLELSILPLALFTFKAIKMIYLYRSHMRVNFLKTIAAGLAGLGLAHTIARAVLWGFLSQRMPFLRTPKLTGKAALLQSIFAAGQEWMLLLALLAACYGVSVRSASVTLDLQIWLVVLIMQTTPYLAAVLVSLISACPWLPAWLLGRAARDASPGAPNAGPATP